MRAIFTGLVVLLGIVAVAVSQALFVVDQTEQALVLEFGSLKRTIREPGLYWKVPIIQNVRYFDKRILDLDTPPQEATAKDQNRLVIDAFARFQIIDPARYFQRVGNDETARSQLNRIVNSALLKVLAGANFFDIVRDKREALMRNITQLVDKQVRDETEGLGISIIDVRLRLVNLPEANSEVVYKRMQTERQRQAAEYRAQGEEAARKIRAQADQDATVTIAKATGEGERIRGAGDATRNKIFADAFGRDPDFFAFYRSMKAYEAGLKAGDTRLLLSPDSEFFRYFNDPTGGASKP